MGITVSFQVHVATRGMANLESKLIEIQIDKLQNIFDLHHHIVMPYPAFKWVVACGLEGDG